MAAKKPVSKKRTVGLIGGILGVAAAGVAAGVATERYLTHRSRRGEDPLADEPFGELPFDEELTVIGAQDIPLHVEIVDSDNTEVTVVFVHGYCLDMGTFHFQRREFAGRYRSVFYDQPGHGRSGRLTKGEYTVDGLGESLKAVIDACVPTGRIVLIGHSMGGMTIMALAEQEPALFERVAGVVLISSSAGKVAEVKFGLPELVGRFQRPLLPVIRVAGPLTSGVVDRARGAATDLAWLLTRRYGFGTARPSPALVSYVERMNSTTSTDVIARYLRTLYAHSRDLDHGALPEVPVQIICGDVDLLTPVDQSYEIAAALPDAEVVIVPDGGHVVLLELADEVDEAMDRFLRKVTT